MIFDKGRGILTFMNGTTSDKFVNLWETYICGFLGGIGIFEAAHLTGVFFDKSLSFCGKLFVGLLAAACVSAVVYMIVKSRKKSNVRRRSGSIRAALPAAIVFLGVLAAQIFYICTTSMMQIPGDITLETVNSFLVTDGIYTVSPLTGKPFGGAPLRYEILCLPTVYTLLCRGFSIAPEMLVGRVMPVVTLCTAYAAYYLLSGTLFGKEKENSEKRFWFLVIIGVLFFLCEKSVYAEGYGILHGGHLGTTIRNSILVPFVIYSALEKKWLKAILCILAEACIVWTFWGLGVCGAVFAGILLLNIAGILIGHKGLFSKIRKKEEDGL